MCDIAKEPSAYCLSCRKGFIKSKVSLQSSQETYLLMSLLVPCTGSYRTHPTGPSLSFFPNAEILATTKGSLAAKGNHRIFSRNATSHMCVCVCVSACHKRDGTHGSITFRACFPASCGERVLLACRMCDKGAARSFREWKPTQTARKQENVSSSMGFKTISFRGAQNRETERRIPCPKRCFAPNGATQ